MFEYTAKRFVSGVVYRFYRAFRPDVPLYTPGAIRHLQTVLAGTSARIFEWGSGRSTLWYAVRAAHVVSIEHDAGWYAWVLQQLAQSKMNHVELLLLPPLPDEDLKGFCWQIEWKFYNLLGHPPQRPGYRDYMAAIDKYDDGSLDLVAVDGKERVGCLVHAMPKLRRGGVLVLDDSNRTEYAPYFTLLSDWTVARYPFGLRETSVFVKPLRG